MGVVEVSRSVTGCILAVAGCCLWVSLTISQGVTDHPEGYLWPSLEGGWLSLLVMLVIS